MYLAKNGGGLRHCHRPDICSLGILTAYFSFRLCTIYTPGYYPSLPDIKMQWILGSYLTILYNIPHLMDYVMISSYQICQRQHDFQFFNTVTYAR